MLNSKTALAFCKHETYDLKVAMFTRAHSIPTIICWSFTNFKQSKPKNIGFSVYKTVVF